MYGCESWTVKKAEHRRLDAFEMWCWRRLLRVPWTARRSNQSILKEITPGCSLEGMILKLKLHYLGHLMRRVDSMEKTLMLGGLGARGEGDDRGWDGWMALLTWWMWVWMNSGRWWWTGRPGVLWFMGSQRVGHDWVTELNWTEDWVWERNVRCTEILSKDKQWKALFLNCFIDEEISAQWGEILANIWILFIHFSWCARWDHSPGEIWGSHMK